MHLTISRPGAKRAVAGIGAALAATLGVSAPSAGVQASAAPECDTAGPSAARVAAGSSHGEDPNSVTAAEAKAMEAKMAQKAARSRQRSSTGPISIRTYVHILETNSGAGGVTQSQVKAQIAVLNKAYAGKTSPYGAATPFRFVLAGTDVTKKTSWYNWNLNLDDGTETAAAKAAKRALHRGTMEDLNLYVAGLGSGLLGYATFPMENLGKLDGVVMLNESLPGGDASPYNLGDTATHEVGHWLGLYHTFEGGCTPPGDYVNDTPAQDDGDNIFYCGETKEFGDDTCPAPGKDPVHNFMSYGDDPCLNRFTSGQGQRMVDAWEFFREGR